MFTTLEFKGRVKEMLNAAGITDVPEVYIKGEIARKKVERMTGIECLRKEMIERGCTSAQAESKAVMVVLDIITNNGDKYVDLWEREKAESEKVKEARNEMYRIQENKKELERDMRKVRAGIDEITGTYEKYCDYIEMFNESLIQCETEEGRDIMRRAQMFVNSVDINSKYDNTAFIVGLAAILSSGKCGAIDEMKKINPKLFDKEKAEETLKDKGKNLYTLPRYGIRT